MGKGGEKNVKTAASGDTTGRGGTVAFPAGTGRTDIKPKEERIGELLLSDKRSP